MIRADVNADDQMKAKNAERAAIMHIHGGGYRQFAHRGYSVYGYALHLGFIHYMLEQGYTVLDFDYRGSAGFGRDYRTDIAESMDISDTDGAAAAAAWLAGNANVVSVGHARSTRSACACSLATP